MVAVGITGIFLAGRDRDRDKDLEYGCSMAYYKGMNTNHSSRDLLKHLSALPLPAGNF